MNTRNPPRRDGDKGEENDPSVEPRQSSEASQRATQFESLLGAVQETLLGELRRVKEDIILRIADVEDSVEMIAREMARQLSEPKQNSDMDV